MRRAFVPGTGPELRARWRGGARLGAPARTPGGPLPPGAQQHPKATGAVRAAMRLGWGLLTVLPFGARAETGAALGQLGSLTSPASPFASALGLWLSLVSLTAGLAWVSYRLGQSRERQQQQGLQAHSQTQAQREQAQAQAEAADQAGRDAADRAERERLALQAALRQGQTGVLQAAALPLLLAEACPAPEEGSGDSPGPTDTRRTPPPTQAAGASNTATAPGHLACGTWVLAQLNPAAAALWPDARAGDRMDTVLQRLQGPGADGVARPAQPDNTNLPDGATALPASVGGQLAAALPGLTPGGSAEQGGWRLVRLATPALGQDTLLLAASGPGWAASAGQPPSPASTAPSSAPVPASAPATPPSGEGAAAESEQFSFTLSHDLRAPIRVVEGFTRIVKEDYGRLLDRVGNDHLDRVLGAAARMNLMIDALLTLARLSSQPLARQPVNLTQLAHYVIDDLKRQQPERAAQVDIEAGLTAVGDPTLLRLVLENLLGNAWKYSARSASTHIEFKREAVDGRPAFVVRDQGAGFDMRSADRLFGLFQRLHSANDFPGTGVGLASVRRIVRRHGGEIWAEAEPGRGAHFHFTLAN